MREATANRVGPGLEERPEHGDGEAAPGRRGRSPVPHIVAVTADVHARLVGDVGCSAAAAFVSVVLEATPEGRGRLVAETSARTLARRLGIDKDSAARALAALVRRGYLERLPQPRVGGRFGPARYRVLLPAGISRSPAVTTAGSASPSPSRVPRATAGRSRDQGGQLGLFPASSSADTESTR